MFSALIKHVDCGSSATRSNPWSIVRPEGEFSCSWVGLHFVWFYSDVIPFSLLMVFEEWFSLLGVGVYGDVSCGLRHPAMNGWATR